MAVSPTPSEIGPARSRRSLVDQLTGWNPALVLEAASLVIWDIEQHKWDSLTSRLPTVDRRGIAKWRNLVRREGTPLGPVPFHPLSVLQAATIALATSSEENTDTSDDSRNKLAGNLSLAAFHWTDDVIGSRSSRPEDYAGAASRSWLWREIGDDSWLIWSQLIVNHIESDWPDVVQQLRHSTGLTLDQWYHRTFGEWAGRYNREPGSYRDSIGVDPALEAAWRNLTTTSLRNAIEIARESLSVDRRGIPIVKDPFDLLWLAERPVIELPTGARFQLWRDALARVLTPGSVAEMLARETSFDIDRTGSEVGLATERALEPFFKTASSADEKWIREDRLHNKQTKCDLVIETDNELLGIEITATRPLRSTSAGDAEGLREQALRIANKAGRQIFNSFDQVDPARKKRRIPVLVYGTPMVADPNFNETVHRNFVESGLSGPESEIMSFMAPSFADLALFSNSSGKGLGHLLVECRDDPDLSGGAPHIWLYKIGARGLATRHIIEAARSDPETTLGVHRP